MDSGVADSVAPPSVGKGFAIHESAGSKVGQTYLTADGTPLPNLGEKAIVAETSEGNVFSLGFQVANVTKPLAAVGKICDAGNWVTFGPQSGYIESTKSGVVTEFQRENGVYMLEVWARAPNQTPGFARQG